MKIKRGRPTKEREIKYYKIVQSVCTPTEWREIVRKAVKQAKLGDCVAREWLGKYLMGTPAQVFEVIGNKDQPVRIRQNVKLDLSNLTDDELDRLAKLANKIGMGNTE